MEFRHGSIQAPQCWCQERPAHTFISAFLCIDFQLINPLPSWWQGSPISSGSLPTSLATPAEIGNLFSDSCIRCLRVGSRWAGLGHMPSLNRSLYPGRKNKLIGWVRILWPWSWWGCGPIPITQTDREGTGSPEEHRVGGWVGRIYRLLL